MPSYNTATAATALRVTPKWLDNLLSHNTIDGFSRDSQGVARRLSLATITVLALAKELVDTLELSVPAALRLADRILDDSSGHLVLSPALSLAVHADSLKSDLLARLAHAVESAPSPRRGRPPKR
jgi:hypothetical protein